MVTVGLVLFVVALIVSLVGSVMMLFAAFRVSTLWGLLVFFVPFAALVFLFMYWQEAKKAFFVSAAGLGVAVLAGLTMGLGGFSAVPGVTEQADAETLTQTQIVQPDSAGENTPPAASAGAPQAAPVAPPPELPVDAAAPTDTRVAENTAPPEIPDLPGGQRAEAGEPELPGLTALNLEEHVGEQLLVVEKSGRSVRGTLLSVSPETLRLERRIAGGTVEYSVARANIQDVRTTR